MQLQCRQRQRSCASAFPCLAERPRDAEQNGASGVAVQCGAVHKIAQISASPPGSFKSLIFWIQEEVIRSWLWQIANWWPRASGMPLHAVFLWIPQVLLKC